MDSSSVFLGVRIPDLPYKRVCFNDINLQCSLVESGLREMAANQFSLNEKELGMHLFLCLFLRVIHYIDFYCLWQSLCTAAVPLKARSSWRSKASVLGLRFM